MSEQYRKDNLGFEIDKLSKQIKLLQELDKLYSEQKDKTLSVQRSVENTTKIMELQRKLEQQGIKNIQNQNDLNEKSAELDRLRAIKWDERLRIEQSITKAQKEELQNQEKLNKKEEELSKRKDDRAKRQARNEIDSYRNQSKTVELKKQIAKLEEESFLKDKAKKTSTKMEHLENNKKINALKKELELQTKIENVKSNSEKSIKNSINRATIPGLGSVGSLKEFSELNTSAKVFSVAVDAFNKTVDNFVGAFKDGMNAVAGKANSQFHNIATMTGMSYGTYRNGIGGMGNRLRNWNGYNLQDNIKTSDVQDAMNSLASAGVSRESLLSNAVENAITNTIVPYLDTQSENFILLNERIGGDFSKQIRGISKANIEIAGNNLATKDILNSMIDLVKPMSDEALENLAKGSTEVSAMVNKLMKEQGWSKENAEAYATSMFKYQKYGASQLAGASTSDKLKYYNILHSGYDLGDLNNANNIMGIALDTDMRLMGMTPGYGNNISRLQSNTFADAMGIDYNYRQQLYSSNKKGLSGSSLSKSTDLTNAQFNNYGNQATQDLANGDTQTTRDKQLTQLENLSTEVAMWKVDSGLWFDTLTTAVQGIAKILVTWAAGKVVGNIGSKLVGGASSGTGTLLKAGLTQGFAKGSTKAFGAGKIGALSGTGGAIAGAAGIAAGGAMAIDGGSRVISDFQSGDVNAGTALAGTEAAGGAIGAGALIALGASNPIGWVALAVGGLAMVGKAAYDTANSYKQAGKKVEKEWDNQLHSIQGEIRERENSIYATEEYLKNEKDTEKARAELINSGMLSEEDTQKAQKASREELEKLTKQYKASTQDFKGLSSDIMSDLKIKQSKEANDSVKSIQDWLKGDASKNYNKSNEDTLAYLRTLMVEEIKAKGDSASHEEKEYLKRVDKNNKKTKYGQADMLWEFNSWDDGYKAIGKALSSEDIGKVTRLANNKGISGIKRFNYISEEDVSSALELLSRADSKEKAEEAFGLLKGFGYANKDMLPTDDSRAKVESLISQYGASYRVGTDNVPYDNYPALLHEGEAVLTASTANDLRGLIDEYRETKSNNIRITQAIENQTEALIAKLDAIYTKMPGNDESNAKDTMPGRLMQNVKQMTLPFN